MKRYSHIKVNSLPRRAEFTHSIDVITPSGSVAVYGVYRLGDYCYFSLANLPGVTLIVRARCGSCRVLGDMAYAAGLV